MRKIYYIYPLLIISALILGACGIAGNMKLDPVSKDFYEYARLIMTGPEKDIFNHLPDYESREQFIEEFWLKRDPDPGTEENEFEEEFFRRIDYANQRFREGIPGWKTPRGRIYIYLGPPDRVMQRPYINDPQIKGMILWGYYKYQVGIEFVDRKGDGCYDYSRQNSIAGGLLHAIERAKFGQTYSIDFEKVISDFDLNYNKETGEIEASLPVNYLSFEAEEGLLKAAFEFEFFIYERKGKSKDRIKREKFFEIREEKLPEIEKIYFTFPYDLKPGKYYFDVVLIVKPDITKVRKIFKIKL